QREIEQHELEGLGAQHPRGSLRVVHPVDDEALALQARADGLADHHVVFHQQQPHLRSMINRADERARSLGLSAVELSAAERLVEDAGSLGVRLTDADAGRLLALLEELPRWNRSYNLTVIRTLGAMVTHHLLDSLAAVASATVVARAIAPLPKLLAQVRGLVAAHSRLLAMKGRWPEKELEALPSSWRLVGSRELTVPRLGEARCVLVLALAVD